MMMNTSPVQSFTVPMSNAMEEPPLEYAPDKPLRKDYDLPSSQRIISSSTAPTTIYESTSENVRPLLVSSERVASVQAAPQLVNVTPMTRPATVEPLVLSTTRPIQQVPLDTIPYVQQPYVQSSQGNIVTTTQTTVAPLTYGPAPFQLTPIVYDRNRYGNTTIQRRIPIPAIDMPMYIMNADDKSSIHLHSDRTDVSLTQQVLVSKFGILQRLLGHKERFQWIYTPEGHIVSNVNRQMALSFKEVPHTREILVVAKNYEILGGMLPKWRVIPAGVSSFMRIPPEFQLCYICLDADPSMVLDVQRVTSINEITGMKRFVEYC